ncbi:hypothetical protein [Methylophaga sulfidovorans]|nr:hypothetical protein [Methylophaga sulfidovorans]
MGITLAGTSTKVSLYAARVNNCICSLADFVSEESGFYKQNAYKKGISDPKFVIRLSEKGLVLCEEKEPAHYLLPRRSENGKEDVFEDIHHIVIPDWLIESWGNN